MGVERLERLEESEMEIKRDYYYYSDIILHSDGTVNEEDEEENIQVYHSNIVLLLTGVVREELEEVMDDENILNSNLVRELGKLTRTELTSDEVFFFNPQSKNIATVYKI